jgi:hypothetical protein
MVDSLRLTGGIWYLICLADGVPESAIFIISSGPKRMKNILLTLLMILLPVASCLAAPADLYTAKVVVENQQLSERNRALPLALMQVLQKLSGLRHFDMYPLVEDSLDSAGSMLVSFHYRNAEGILADGSVFNELRLVAQFSEPEVNELFKSLQLPLWRPERQATQVWLVVDDGLDRRIMPLEFAYAWEAMDKAAASRGMPVVWPQPDDEGNYPVDVQLLWGGYTEDLVQLGANAVMVAAARREGPEWSVRINLGYEGQNWTWRNRDVDLQLVLSESMQQAVDRVAQANTIIAADQGRWPHELTVTGIAAANDYARCLAYLQNLSVVEQVRVARASAGRVRFKLELNALPQYLDQALSSGSMLEFIDSEDAYLLRQ